MHGCADKLVGLLRRLGYRESDGAWRRTVRQVVFVGDLIDRGIQQRDSVCIARSMVEAGAAQIVLGNHEFNAVAYSTWSDERSDWGLDGQPFPPLPDDPLDDDFRSYADDVPVIVGHYSGADAAITELVRIGVLEEITGGRRNRRYAATAVLAALDAFVERAGGRSA